MQCSFCSVIYDPDPVGPRLRSSTSKTASADPVPNKESQPAKETIDLFISNSASPITDADIELEKTSASGSYATVRKGIVNVAVKTTKGGVGTESILLARKEAFFLNEIKSDNVVRSFGFYENLQGTEFSLIMEQMDEPLDSYMSLLPRTTSKNLKTVVDKRYNVLKQIAQGLVDIHKLGIVHNDLKPANVLVLNDRYKTPSHVAVKICDFGLAAYEGDEMFGTTRKWEDPLLSVERLKVKTELTVVHRYNDIYSFGIIVWNVFTGEDCYHYDYNSTTETSTASFGSRDAFLAAIKKDTVPDNLKVYAGEGGFIWELIRNCCIQDVKKRYNAIDIVNFFN